jgi:putative addiction module component (TIGR02574 family)
MITSFWMGKISFADVLDLSISERIQLVEDIWDSIATAAEPPPLTDAQRAELDCRLSTHGKNPNAGSAWNDVKQKIAESST